MKSDFFFLSGGCRLHSYVQSTGGLFCHPVKPEAYPMTWDPIWFKKVRKLYLFIYLCLHCFVASSESPFSLMETEPCSHRTRPDALSNQPVQPQTLAHFQSIGSTEVELPHTRRTLLCNRLEQRALFWMRFGASHLRAASRGATFESIICSSVTHGVLMRFWSVSSPDVCTGCVSRKHKGGGKTSKKGLNLTLVSEMSVLKWKSSINHILFCDWPSPFWQRLDSYYMVQVTHSGVFAVKWHRLDL